MRKTRRNLLIVTIMVFAMAFTLIGPTSTAQAAKKLKITSAPKKMVIGKKAVIKTNIPAYFKTSNGKIASINVKGVVKAKSEGVVKITAANRKKMADQKTIKITIVDPATPDPKPNKTIDLGDYEDIIIKYRGKIPKGSHWLISPYATTVTVKGKDGTEKILNPSDYDCYCKGVIEKNGKEFADCVFECGNVTKNFEVEMVDTKGTIPVAFEAIYPEDKVIKKGEKPSLSDTEMFVLYADNSMGPLAETSTTKLILLRDREEYNVYEYLVLYENVYEYNGEKLYLCVGFPIYVKYK